MRNLLRRAAVPGGAFALALLLAALAGPASFVHALRRPQAATPCTAKAEVKAATLQVIKFDFLLTDLAIQVDATGPSKLVVTPTLEVRADAELVHTPQPNHVYPFMKLTLDFHPKSQDKSYKAAVSKLEKDFKPFGVPAKDMWNALDKRIQEIKKDRPEEKGASAIIRTVRSSFWIVNGTYVCTDTKMGTFTPNDEKRVNIDANGDGKGTLP